jgi:hypothetical protein
MPPELGEFKDISVEVHIVANVDPDGALGCKMDELLVDPDHS